MRPRTGLYYNGFNYYDPLTGRYLQPDPLGLSGGLNSYTYALNNPLRYIDPEGRNPLALLPLISRLAVGWVIGEAMDYLIGYLPDNECNPLLSPRRWVNAASYAIGISAAQKGLKALTAAAKLRRGLGGRESATIEGLSDISGFLSSQSVNINKKLGKKIGEGRLPYEASKVGVEKAKITIKDTLEHATQVSSIIPKSSVRGEYDLIHIYSSKTNSTVSLRVLAKGKYEFDTLIPQKSSKF